MELKDDENDGLRNDKAEKIWYIYICFINGDKRITFSRPLSVVSFVLIKRISAYLSSKGNPILIIFPFALKKNTPIFFIKI